MAKTKRKRKNKLPAWTGKIPTRAVVGGFVGIVLLVLSLISLASNGDLRLVLGLPETPAPSPMPDGTLSIYYLDVGQADCELMSIPKEDGSRYTVLIDAGDNGGEDELLQTLNDLGVEKIDLAVFTHPHADHIGGAAEVLSAIETDRVCLPPVPESMTPTTATYESMLDILIEREIPVTQAESGLVLYEDKGVSLTVLSPSEQDDWDNLNDWSVVLRLVYGDTAFLFMGDAEEICEEQILDSGAQLSCDVLKVGHHGSATSTSASFLQAASPHFAVISCGKDNTYGHPDAQTLETLQNQDVTVFRTDEDGTILAVSDGENVTTAPLNPAA